MTTLNYQQIYEDEVPQTIKDSLELPRFYADFSHHMRLLIEEVADAGARVATETVLDPEIMEETASLAAEMGAQLYQFANMIQGHTAEVAPFQSDEDI